MSSIATQIEFQSKLILKKPAMFCLAQFVYPPLFSGEPSRASKNQMWYKARSPIHQSRERFLICVTLVKSWPTEQKEFQ